MLNSTTWLYGAEVLHSHRSRPKRFRQYQTELLLRLCRVLVLLPYSGVFLFSVSFSNIFCVMVETLLIRCGSETKQKTLEIAAAFGDKVVLLTEIDIADEEAVVHGLDAKARDEQVESSSAVMKVV